MSEKLSIDEQLHEAKGRCKYWFDRAAELEKKLNEAHESELQLAHKVDVAKAANDRLTATVESLATTIEDRCNDLDELKAENAALRERVAELEHELSGNVPNPNNYDTKPFGEGP